MSNVFAFMHVNHEEIDQLFSVFPPEPSKSIVDVQRFHAWADRIEQHMVLEENTLFVYFEKFTKIERMTGVLELIARDHIAIRKLINDVREAIDKGETEKYFFFATHLKRAIFSHKAREEAMLYPIFDRTIPMEEWEKILASNARSMTR